MRSSRILCFFLFCFYVVVSVSHRAPHKMMCNIVLCPSLSLKCHLRVFLVYMILLPRQEILTDLITIDNVITNRVSSMIEPLKHNFPTPWETSSVTPHLQIDNVRHQL